MLIALNINLPSYTNNDLFSNVSDLHINKKGEISHICRGVFLILILMSLTQNFIPANNINSI